MFTFVPNWKLLQPSFHIIFVPHPILSDWPSFLFVNIVHCRYLSTYLFICRTNVRFHPTPCA